jgi:hypothetical protein
VPHTVDLFELDELPTMLQVSEVDTASAELARRLASGWIRSNAGRTFDDSVPEAIHGWALELASLLYNNPRALRGETAGPYSYQAGDRERRDQILAEVRQWRDDQDRGTGRQAPRSIAVTPALAMRTRHPSRWRGGAGW